MQKPLAPIVPVDFSLPNDIDNPTVFEIRALTGAEYMRCMCHASAAQADPEQAAISLEKAVRLGLVGWRNFGEVKFDTNNQTANLDRLDMNQFAALGNEIRRLSRVAMDDKKK